MDELSLHTPRPIDDLYEEVRDYDLVLTADAPLATALNQRVRGARLGKLAMTPKEVASRHAYRYFHDALITEADTVTRIASDLGLPLKHVHNAVQHIMAIRAHTPSVTPFLNETERAVYRILQSLPTELRSRELFESSALSGLRVAVIGTQLFDELDRLVLPEDYDDIALFSDRRYNPAPLYLLDGEDAVIAAIGPLLTKEREQEIAIVAHSASSMTTRLKSYLYGKGITINERRYLRDDLGVRTILSLLFSTWRLTHILVREVRPFLEMFGIDADATFDDFRFAEYVRREEGRDALSLFELLDACKRQSFGDAVRAISERLCSPNARITAIPEAFWKALDAVGVLTKPVTWQRLSDLSYYVYSMNVSLDSTKTGIVIVDSASALYVDRPVCIYVGLDASWAAEPQAAPYIDGAAELARDLVRFQVMLCQGKERYYLATAMKDNAPTMPSFYFNILYGRDIKGFDDELFSTRRPGIRPTYAAALPAVPPDEDTTPFEIFSQSSLRTFVTCPKKYEYSLLVPGTEKTFFLKGTLIHAFAEVYAARPDLVRERGEAFFADLLTEQYLGIAPRETRELERTDFALAIKAIMAFLDASPLQPVPSMEGLTRSPRHGKNPVAAALGIAISSPASELYFEDSSLHLKGIIDLLQDKTTIVDYKSSLTPLTPSGAMKRMQPALSGDEVDYQPLVYLAKLRKETPGATLTFLYVYPLGTKHEMMKGKGSVEDLLLKVVYLPHSFASFLETPSSLAWFATSKDRTAFLNDKGNEQIARWIADHPFPDPLRGAGPRDLTAYAEELSAAFGSEKGAQSLVSDIAAFRKGKAGYNKETRAVYLFEDDLDAFLSFVDTQLARMRECLRTGFSREPLSTSLCGTCEYRDLCCGGWD